MRIGERLSAFEGSWSGEHRLRMMPDDEFDTSASTALVAAAARGNVATLTYTWADFDDVEQAGLIVLSDGASPSTVDVVWSDSWHQQPQWMVMSGSATEAKVSFSGAYGEGDETAEWHIHLHLDDPGTLVMTMDNVMPAISAYEVVRATWRKP